MKYECRHLTEAFRTSGARCKAGVVYEEHTGGRLGFFVRLPCMKPITDPHVVPCDRKELWSDEELLQKEREAEANSPFSRPTTVRAEQILAAAQKKLPRVVQDGPLEWHVGLYFADGSHELGFRVALDNDRQQAIQVFEAVVDAIAADPEALVRLGKYSPDFLLFREAAGSAGKVQRLGSEYAEDGWSLNDTQTGWVMGEPSKWDDEWGTHASTDSAEW